MYFPTITPPPRLPVHLGLTFAPPLPDKNGLRRRAWAQPENCVSGFTNTNTACQALTSRIDTCATVIAGDSLKPIESNPQFASCFCRQDLFSDLAVCKGIHRQCILDYAYDPNFDKYQSQWMEFCGSAVPSLHVTTPPVPKVTVPVVSDKCEYVKTACERYERYRGICETSYAENEVNCRCQAQVEYVESICSVDGAALCATGTAAGGGKVELSDLWAYQSCKNWLGIPGTLAPGGSSYIRGAAATPKVTNVPFVDFPLTYFDVPTDPVFSEPTTSRASSGNTSSGVKIRVRGLAVGLYLSLAAWMNLL